MKATAPCTVSPISSPHTFAVQRVRAWELRSNQTELVAPTAAAYLPTDQTSYQNKVSGTFSAST